MAKTKRSTLIALIADVHSNLVALDAVLEDTGKLGATRIYCAGDIVGTGPDPNDCLRRLSDANALLVKGNTDIWVLEPTPSDSQTEAEERLDEIDRWNALALSSRSRRLLEETPSYRAAVLNGQVIHLFHGSPIDPGGVLMPGSPLETPQMHVDSAMTGLLVGGHTHVQAAWQLAEHQLMINPGSVGLSCISPNGRERQRLGPVAQWTLLALRGDEPPAVFPRTVPFELDAARRRARSSGMPHADWWGDQICEGGFYHYLRTCTVLARPD